MKKLVVFAGLILLCTLAQAQGGSDSGTSAGITIVPRVDFNPVFYGGTEKEVTLGNSSLYSLFEGNITDNLSFSVCNHWLSSESKSLYQNTWHSDDVSWCDWANLTYSFGNFYVTAGKDMVSMGGFEFDQYDFDVHPDLCSSLWNNFSCYQWGGKFGFMNEDETQGISLQLTSSPYSVRPFGDGLMTIHSSTAAATVPSACSTAPTWSGTEMVTTGWSPSVTRSKQVISRSYSMPQTRYRMNMQSCVTEYQPMRLRSTILQTTGNSS